MNLKHILLFPAFLLAGLLPAQQPSLAKWWVEFSDKNNSPYCTCRPAEFLSARALERRARAGIPLQEHDLPVNPQYLRALESKGVRLHNTSRWLNTATVIADSATAATLTGLPFVRNLRYLGPDISIKNPPNRPPKQRKPVENVPIAGDDPTGPGYAGLQNSLLGVPLLHAAGHRGNGIWVAVLDGGFVNADTLPFFDSAAMHGRLYEGWDFVERDGAVFETAQHGTSVLSVMAADLPGYFVGTAPEATYFLLKTEDTGGEFPVEETNLLAGLEWADSIGADIVNASLGYTVFNDTTLSHTFSELDGRTAIGSRGAAIAATKGMLVCNSAGNSGDEPWTYLGVPADAPGVIAVGAVSHDGSRATFSSQGPTADGRIKPDLVAPGETVVVAGNAGVDLSLSNGTSLAAPMLAGALASLWSAFPEKTAGEILNAVFAGADQTDAPDTLRGFGLPDMARSWLTLGGYLHGSVLNNARAGFFAFGRANGVLGFLLFGNTDAPAPQVELRNALGETIQMGASTWRAGAVSSLAIAQLQDLPPGYYQVVARTDTAVVRLAGLVWR